MKRWGWLYLCILIGCGVYFYRPVSASVCHFYKSMTVYAAIPEQIPLKLQSQDEEGNTILDSYTYTYHLTGIDGESTSHQITYEYSGETVIPLEPKSYIRFFMLFGHPIGSAHTIELTKIPTSILEKLETENTHQARLKWTTTNP